MQQKPQLPRTLSEGRTPEAWCELLQEMHGIKVSTRRVRSIARATGNFCKFGRNMLLLPHHLDNISETLIEGGSNDA